MSSSIYRRLHGIFTKSASLPRKSDNGVAKTSPAQTTKKTTTIITGTVSSSSKKKSSLKRDVEECKQLSDSSTFRSKYKNYETLVIRLASANQQPMIEDLLEHLKTYKDMENERYAIRLIALYGKSGMFGHAQKVFDEMPELNCKRTVTSVNALLSACIKSKQIEKFDELLKDLPLKLSVEPNVITYNTVIKALCKTGLMDTALSAIEKMEERGLVPDLITYNTLLYTYYTNNQFSEGEKIWAMIENKNLVHNIRSYNSRLRGLVFEGRLVEAVKLFEELKSKGLKPDVHSYNTIIKGFCNEGNLEEVKKWYKKLLEWKYMPDKYTFAMLLPFLCEKGDFDTGFEVCKEALKRRIVVHVASIQLVVDGLVKELKMDKAIKLVNLGRSNDTIVTI